MKLVETKQIRGQEVNADKKLTNKALLEFFSNGAMYHTFLGGDTSSEGVSPVSWMVMGWKMQVFSRPYMFSNVTVETWVQRYTRVKARRNYRVTDEEGNIVAVAAAEWVAMNAATNMFVRLTPEVMDHYTSENEEEVLESFFFNDYRKFEEPAQSSKLITPLYSMNDYNCHLHNSEYIYLADEIIPGDPLHDVYDDVEIYYRQQVKPGEEVLLEYCVMDGRKYVAVKSPEDGSLHTLIILS